MTALPNNPFFEACRAQALAHAAAHTPRPYAFWTRVWGATQAPQRLRGWSWNRKAHEYLERSTWLPRPGAPMYWLAQVIHGLRYDSDLPELGLVRSLLVCVGIPALVAIGMAAFLHLGLAQSFDLAGALTLILTGLAACQGVARRLRDLLSPLDAMGRKYIQQWVDERPEWAPAVARWVERLGELRLIEMECLFHYMKCDHHAVSGDALWAKVKAQAPEWAQSQWARWHHGRRLPTARPGAAWMHQLTQAVERQERCQAWRQGLIGAALEANALREALVDTPVATAAAPSRRRL